MSKVTPDEDQLLDEALNNYPLAPLPVSFVEQVMARIDARPALSNQSRFRLEFLDVAIPIFVGSFALVVLAFTGNLGAIANPVPQFQLAWLETTAGVSASSLALVAIVLFFEMSIAIVLGFWLWADRPFQSAQQKA